MNKEKFYRTQPDVFIKPEKHKLVKVTTMTGKDYFCYRINKWEYFVKDNPLLTIEHRSIGAWEYVNEE